METMASISRRAPAEVVGTGFLLLAIVGSGIAADRLTDDAAVTLLVNALVTGAALTAVISAVGPISGAHLNPAVTVAIAMERDLPWRDAPFYVGAQVAGAAIGVVAANLMFDLPAVDVAKTSRVGAGPWLGEFIATFGLLNGGPYLHRHVHGHCTDGCAAVRGHPACRGCCRDPPLPLAAP